MIKTVIDQKQVYISEDFINYLAAKERQRQKTNSCVLVTPEMVNEFLLNNRTHLFPYEDTVSIVKPTSRRAQNGGPEVDEYRTKEMELFHLNSLISESLAKTYRVKKKDDLEDRTIGIYALSTGKDKKMVIGVYAKID